ncbi:MAG: thioredoxin domain-containing protein [Bacteroidetes bacterium]|nr:thioredoxin domain-containing protein [Bacteroidota bacterium]
MNVIRRLIDPLLNCDEALIELCKQLGVNISNSSIEKSLEEHPDYPSLLSLSDVLKSYGVDNVSIKTADDNLRNIPSPFIAQIKSVSTKQDLFSVIYKFDTFSMRWFNPETHKRESISPENFSRIFTGIVLFAEPSEDAGEKNYLSNQRKEKINYFIKLAAILAIPAVTLIFCLITFLNFGMASFNIAIYTLLTLFGCITGSLLLFYEIDQYNPVLQQICHAGKKTNCGAILNSKASKILGISWSSIGFSYFFGILFALLTTGLHNSSTIFLVSWINVLALPYIIFSVYYQWQVAKEWCVLCLTVLIILILQFVTAYFGGFHRLMSVTDVTIMELISIVFCFLIPFLATNLLVPAFEKVKESRNTKISLQRIKHNPQIFEALLIKQKRIKESTEGLGITLGSPQATIKLIKVCNPYCDPCAKAHFVLEELLHNNSGVQLQIIFTATGNETDVKTPPVKHILAVAEEGDNRTFKKALDDWYSAENKDYNKYAKKYPTNGELQNQTEKVKAMYAWCNKLEINYTPTFFINGYQLPEIYDIADLKYFLSV